MTHHLLLATHDPPILTCVLDPPDKNALTNSFFNDALAISSQIQFIICKVTSLTICNSEQRITWNLVWFSKCKWHFICDLRRLERVFRCCSVCETMEDYKEGYLMGWANYMSPCNSIAGLYFEGTCDVISVTMETHKVHKKKSTQF